MLPSLSCTMEFCLSLPGHLKVCSVSEAPAVQKLQGDSEGCVMLAKETYIIRSIVKSSEATSSFSSPPDNSLTDVLRPAVASDVAAPCKVRRIFKLLLLATLCPFTKHTMTGYQAVMSYAVAHLQRS